MNSMSYDIVVVGGGVIGAFVARYLSRYQATTLVLEKENDVGDVTSMANSAIVHSGDDPKPGTLKARFNVAGNRMFDEISSDLDVEFNRCGSLNVAIYEEQLEALRKLQQNAEANGVPTQMLSAEEVKKIEPNINPEVKGALFAPTAGIVNPFTLTSHAMENACDNGVVLHLNEAVTAIVKLDSGFRVKTTKGEYICRVVVNCAGLHSDDIASMVEPIDWSIHPRKGEYYVLDHYAPGLVNHVLFPLPTAKGKGVLVTMTSSGDYLVGPSSEFVDDDEDFSTDVLTLSEVKKAATSLVPSIPFREQIRVFAGLRATPSNGDFIIGPSKTCPGFFNVAGMESPGLASSPAVGQYVADELVAPFLGLKTKENWNPKIRPYVHIASLPLEEQNRLIQERPEYGNIVCNCEKVSLGEIEDVVSRSVPCKTIKAVKKRTRAGFGKCQGGFCQPKVLLFLSKKLGISPLEVLYDKNGSEILGKESK